MDRDRRALRYALLGLGTLAYAALTFAWFSLAAYLPAVREALALSGAQAGLLAGAVPLTYVPLSLASGAVVDRAGPYRAVGAGVAVVGLAHLWRASAAGFPAMLAGTALLGVGGTAVTFGLPKLVSELFPPEAAGTPSSVYVLGASAGTAAAFALGRAVVGPAVGGWRPLFRLTGLAAVGYAGLWLALTRLAPTAALSAPGGEETADAGPGGLVGLRADLARVLGNGPLRLVVLAGVVYLLVVHGFQNWLATVLGARGVPPELAAGATTGFVVAAAAGTLGAPAVSDRLGDRGRVVAACGGLCAAGAAIVAVPWAPAALAAAGALAAGVGAGGISPLVRVVPAELEGVGPALTGTAVGLVFAVGEVGGFLGTAAVGGLYDLTGSYAPGMGLVAACALGAVLAGWRLPV